MAHAQLNSFIRQLRRLALPKRESSVTDAELLERFVQNREEAAFELLAWRHGAMVLGVCQRVLHHEQDVEDAFQATFLTLIRKAAHIGKRESVGSWLYKVAYRVALRARTGSARRASRDKTVARDAAVDANGEALWRDLRLVLDEEVNRLPARYREPFILCHIEGKSILDAAQQLGCPRNTLGNWLARARARLRTRLTRRGVTLSAAALAAVINEKAVSASVPPMLMSSMVQVAVKTAAGQTAGVVSARVAALSKGVLTNMVLFHSKTRFGLVLICALAIAATAYLSMPPAQEGGKPPTPARQQDSKSSPAAEVAKPGRLHVQRNLELTTIQPDGKESKILAKIPDGSFFGFQGHSARLSPDGKWLAFGLAVQNEKDGIIGVYPPNKIHLWEVGQPADPVVLVDDMGASLQSWVWSHDNTKLAFSSWDAAEYTRNWTVDLKTKKVEEVKLPRFRWQDKEVSMSIQAWSPDGAWFLAGGDGLHLVKTDGSTVKQLLKETKNLLGGSCRFSPDGRRVLYTSVQGDDTKKLHRPLMLDVVDLADGKVRRVTDALNFGDLHACWSPDSRRIAYCVRMLNADGTCAGETTIFVADADGQNTSTVMTERHQPNLVALRLMEWR